MITAKELADAVALLRTMETATMVQLTDPIFVGRLAAQACSSRIIFEIELRKCRVQVEHESED